VEHLELVIFALLLAVTALAAAARWLEVPYPILLVLGGLGLGFVPGMPDVQLDPDVVLLIFLPPLLYGAAFFTSLRDLRANARAISLLAIPLVAATMVAVAVLAHYVIGLEWSVAFVLGAVVSPTDAVAPAATLRELGAPRRVLAIIEGENLTNDWTALVLYRIAVGAVVSGSFSFWEAGLEFLLSGLAGVAIGLAVGLVIRELRRRIDDAPTELTISLLTGYAAYLPAEELGVSGIIAAVTVGVYMGWHTPELTTPSTRMQLFAVWELGTFLLNAVLFLLVGLQLQSVLDEISGRSAGELAGYAALVCAAVILVRLVWEFTVPQAVRLVDRRMGQLPRRLDWRQRLIIGWSGMRGSVALAAALAIPFTIEGGAPFPDRDLVLFLTFSVIVVTLVFQGLTLKPLVRWLDVDDDGGDEHEELKARLRAAEAALARLEELADEDWVREDTLERTRALFDYRRRRFSARFDGSDDGAYEERSAAYQRLLRELLGAERDELLALRNEGYISDEVRRRVERDLDLEESRLG
jgi:CPA1 family monovalent cation:H+ antiporter